MDHNQMQNIRNEYYLKIITKPNAKEQLLEKIKYLILGLESSGDLKRYEPTEQDPIYVFKDNVNHRKISLVDETLIPNIALRASSPAVRNSFRSTACSGALAASTLCRLRSV